MTNMTLLIIKLLISKALKEFNTHKNHLYLKALINKNQT